MPTVNSRNIVMRKQAVAGHGVGRDHGNYRSSVGGCFQPAKAGCLVKGSSRIARSRAEPG